MSDPTKWLSAIAIALSIANIIWVWVTKPSRDLAAKTEKLAECVDQHDSRIQSIESELKHIPSKEAVNDLLVMITELKGDFKSTTGELASVGRTVRRIEDSLVGVRAA